jgi:hypothetical protein
MPKTPETKIGLNRFESYNAFASFIILMFILAIVVSPTYADEDDWDQLVTTGQTIELTIDNDEYINGIIDQVNAQGGDDVQQAGDLGTPSPEQLDTTNPLRVNIQNGDNVRNITTGGTGFGNVDSDFPRGQTDAIAWFNDGPLTSIANGTWLILEGGEQAIFGVVVDTTDQQAFTLPEYTYNGSSYVPVAPEIVVTEAPGDNQAEVVIAPTPDAEDSGDDEVVVTPEPTRMYDYQPSYTVTYLVPGNLRSSITETVEVNADRGFAAPLGLISEGFSEVVDSISQYEQTGTGEDEAEWARLPIHGIVISIDNDVDYPDDRKYLTVLTHTPDGNEIIMIVDMMPYIHNYPTDSALNLASSQEEADAVSHISSVVDKDVMYGNITPGTPIIFDIVDVPQGAGGHSVFAIPWRRNNALGGSPNGQPTATFEFIDNGNDNNEDIPAVFTWGANYVINNSGD